MTKIIKTLFVALSILFISCEKESNKKEQGGKEPEKAKVYSVKYSIDFSKDISNNGSYTITYLDKDEKEKQVELNQDTKLPHIITVDNLTQDSRYSIKIKFTQNGTLAEAAENGEYHFKRKYKYFISDGDTTFSGEIGGSTESTTDSPEGAKLVLQNMSKNELGAEGSVSDKF